MSPDTTVNKEIIKKRLWLAYQYACNNPANERMDVVHALISRLADPTINMHDFLQEVADTIHNKLGIKEVTIGLKSSQDGMFKYEVMAGLTDTEWGAHKTLSYKPEDFYSQDVYKSMQISRFTRLFLAEDNPYAVGEESTYEREVMLQSKRKSLDDTIEGDYFDILVFGRGDDLLGWIEISGMSNGRFPDTETIKCLELLASVMGVALARR